jgi:hypothetical protein
MIRFFYHAPQAAFDGLANANHRAVRINANFSFGYIEFANAADRAAFRALPNVTELPHHRSHAALPAALVTALTQHGVLSTDSAEDVAMKIAATFGGLSHEDIFE